MGHTTKETVSASPTLTASQGGAGFTSSPPYLFSGSHYYLTSFFSCRWNAEDESESEETGHASCSGSWDSHVDRRVSAACGATLHQCCCFLFFGVLDSGESIKFKAFHGLSGPFPGKQLVKHLPSKHLLRRRSSSAQQHQSFCNPSSCPLLRRFWKNQE